MKILGISCYYHDAAAALVIDGKIIAAGAEERWSRKKHDSGYPKLAIDFCLKKAGITTCELDFIVFYEKPFLKFERLTLSFLETAPYARGSFVSAYKLWLKDKLWIKAILAKKLGVNTDKILFIGHHLSHAAATFYTSPFDSAAILTCDGVGEWTTTAWGRGKGTKIFLEKELRFPHSLGLLYSVFTQFLGFEINEGEFKVMGLAPYGEPIYKEKVEKLINQSVDGAFSLNMEYFSFHLSDKISYNEKFIKLFGVKPYPKSKSDEVKKIYADIAASVQEVLNDKLVIIAKNLHEKTGEKNLCYGGGVALNGVSNWEIFKKAGFDNLFIHPAAGDDGGALGAALYVYHNFFKKKRKKNIFSNAYLGEDLQEKEIKEFLEKDGIKSKKYSDKELVETVSNLLVKGKVVGWARGRFEWGPRALGNRSILADPRGKKMKDLVNKKIKFREAFRPFAPVSLFEKAEKYFEVGKDYNQQPLEYMTMVVKVKDKWQEKLRATTHVDGSSRPQFIKRSKNPVYYDLVKKFGDKTGVYVLLNTSFNLKGDPIVTTASQAYDTFMRSGIDALVLGNYLIKKGESL